LKTEYHEKKLGTLNKISHLIQSLGMLASKKPGIIRAAQAAFAVTLQVTQQSLSIATTKNKRITLQRVNSMQQEIRAKSFLMKRQSLKQSDSSNQLI